MVSILKSVSCLSSFDNMVATGSLDYTGVMWPIKLADRYSPRAPISLIEGTKRATLLLSPHTWFTEFTFHILTSVLFLPRSLGTRKIKNQSQFIHSNGPCGIAHQCGSWCEYDQAPGEFSTTRGALNQLEVIVAPWWFCLRSMQTNSFAIFLYGSIIFCQDNLTFFRPLIKEPMWPQFQRGVPAAVVSCKGMDLTEHHR